MYHEFNFMRIYYNRNKTEHIYVSTTQGTIYKTINQSDRSEINIPIYREIPSFKSIILINEFIE